MPCALAEVWAIVTTDSADQVLVSLEVVGLDDGASSLALVGLTPIQVPAPVG